MENRGWTFDVTFKTIVSVCGKKTFGANWFFLLIKGLQSLMPFASIRDNIIFDSNKRRMQWTYNLSQYRHANKLRDVFIKSIR